MSGEGESGARPRSLPDPCARAENLGRFRISAFAGGGAIGGIAAAAGWIAATGDQIERGLLRLVAAVAMWQKLQNLAGRCS